MCLETQVLIDHEQGVQAQQRGGELDLLKHPVVSAVTDHGEHQERFGGGDGLDIARNGGWPGCSKANGTGAAADNSEARKQEEEQDRQAGVRPENCTGQ